VPEATQKLYRHTGYEEAIRSTGVYAIELASITLTEYPSSKKDVATHK